MCILSVCFQFLLLIFLNIFDMGICFCLKNQYSFLFLNYAGVCFCLKTPKFICYFLLFLLFSNCRTVHPFAMGLCCGAGLGWGVGWGGIGGKVQDGMDVIVTLSFEECRILHLIGIIRICVYHSTNPLCSAIFRSG